MTKEEIKIYEPDLGLNGTISQLVDWANRYTDDYSDQALEKISELARLHGFGDKEVEIPLLLRNERLKEDNGALESAYARLKIDHYLGNKISLSISNYRKDGTKLEIYEDQEKVVVSLVGVDDEGRWYAAGSYSIEEFMAGESQWLDVAIGNVLYYGKTYEEPDEKSGEDTKIRPSDEDLQIAKKLWDELGDVPIDDDDCITCQWRSFEKGTYRFDIWKWFESFFGVSVAKDLMEVA